MKRNIIKTKSIFGIFGRAHNAHNIQINRWIEALYHTMAVLLFVMHRIRNDEQNRRIAFTWDAKISSTIRYSFIFTLSKTRSVCSAFYSQIFFLFSSLDFDW